MCTKTITENDKIAVLTAKYDASKIIFDFTEKMLQNLHVKINVNGNIVQQNSIGMYRSAINNPSFLLIPQKIKQKSNIAIEFSGFKKGFGVTIGLG